MKKYRYIKLIKKIEIAELDGDKVMVDFKTGKYFWLRGIANEIWEKLNSNEKVDIEELIEWILSEYEVEEVICRKQIQDFLQQIVDIKFAKYC